MINKKLNKKQCKETTVIISMSNVVYIVLQCKEITVIIGMNNVIITIAFIQIL